MELDSTHPALLALKNLIPDAYVAGGSFSAILPDPTGLTREERRTVLLDAQKRASQVCIENLLSLAGLPPKTEVLNKPTGDRYWPRGFVGSLSHKATVIVGVLIEKNRILEIGIDLEYLDGKSLDEDLVSSAEGLLGPSSDLAVLTVFSAKEAVFKAQFPRAQRRLNHPDVRIEWESLGEEFLFQGQAVVLGNGNYKVRAKLVGKWLVSVATPSK